MYSVLETYEMAKEALKSGHVLITRFSDTGFHPIEQIGTIAEKKSLKDRKGCFAFIKGFENTMALNHKKKRWYEHTTFSEGEISIESIINTNDYKFRIVEKRLLNIIIIALALKK